MILRRRAPLALALLAALAGLAPASARAALGAASALAPPLVQPARDGQTPVLILAQRAIDRAWGPLEGVTPPPPPPGMISEGRALALSAVLPGAGQLYSQQMSGVWFALAEVAGWTTHWLFTRNADRERDHAYAFAGAPTDTGSAWSFQRWANAAPGSEGRSWASCTWICVEDVPGAAFANRVCHVAAGSRTTLSGGAVAADPGATPIDWNNESAAGRSTTPATVTVVLG